MNLRRIIAASALLCAIGWALPAHAQSTKAALLAEIPTLCPPNQNQGLCTVQNANKLWADIVNAIMPTAPVTNDNAAIFDGTTGLLKDSGTPLGTMAAQNANNVAITGGNITGLPVPVASADAATKGYVDGASAGLNILPIPLGSTVIATAAILPNSPTYSNGTAGVGATLTAGSNTTLTVDGTAAPIGTLVLVNKQGSAFQNGLYSVTTAGSGSAAWVLTRVTYFDQAAEMKTGSYVFANAGVSNASNAYLLVAPAPTTVGTDPLNWSLFSQSGTTIAGVSGAIVLDPTLSITGKTLAVNTGPVYLSTYLAAAGVVCDGTMHVEVAFQNALNAAITARTPLILPQNAICVLNANITNGSGLFKTTLIQGYGETSQITFLGNTGFQFGSEATYYVLQDFLLNCDSTSNVACLEIFHPVISTALGSVIQRLRFNSCGVICVFFQNMVQAHFLDNIILTTAASGTAALFVDNTQTSDVGGNFIIGNFISNVSGSTTSGMYLQEFGGSQVQNNSVAGYAIDINYALTSSAGSTGILLQNNQLDNCGFACIEFDGGTAGASFIHVSIANNTMHSDQNGSCASSANGFGILLHSSSTFKYLGNVAVTGNTISTCRGSSGIAASAISGLSVTGNVIQDAGGGVPGNAAITLNSTGGGVSQCVVVGNAASQYTVTLSNPAGCVAAGNTSP